MSTPPSTATSDKGGKSDAAATPALPEATSSKEKAAPAAKQDEPSLLTPAPSALLRINETGDVLQGSMHIPVNGQQATDLSGYETVLVDGRLEGSVTRVEWFSLAREGAFTGTADTAYADLSGSVKGEIHCSQKLIIRSTARVKGTLSASLVEIHPGAIIEATIKSYGRPSGTSFKQTTSSEGTASVSKPRTWLGNSR